MTPVSRDLVLYEVVINIRVLPSTIPCYLCTWCHPYRVTSEEQIPLMSTHLRCVERVDLNLGHFWRLRGSQLMTSKCSITNPVDPKGTNGKGTSFFREDQDSTSTDPLPRHLRSTKENKRYTGRTQRHKMSQRRRRNYTRSWEEINKSIFTSTNKEQNRRKDLLADGSRRSSGRTTVVREEVNASNLGDICLKI